MHSVPASPTSCGAMTSARRFPQSVYRHGDEPDARFTLANERTFLAWIRTALALMAAGVALEALGTGMHTGLRLAAALVLILAGIMTAAMAWSGWKRTERTLRLRKPLPAPPIGLPLTVIAVVVGVLVGLAMLLG